MKNLKHFVFIGLSVLLCGGLTAQAQEATQLDISLLAPAQRASLLTEIDAVRAENTAVFAAVQNIVDRANEIDRAKRGTLAPFKLYFKRLGSAALLPMLEKIAIAPPQRNNLRDTAWVALQAGLLEAVGSYRDARAIPVLEAILRGQETEYFIVRAAASARGMLSDDASITTLLELAEIRGDKQIAILSGMGSCRRAAIAQFLADRLQQTTSPKQANILVHSLEEVGNAWAWETPAVREHADDEAETRSIAAQALVNAYLRFENPVRTRISSALLVVGHETTPEWIAQASTNVSTVEKAALSALADRFTSYRDRLR